MGFTIGMVVAVVIAIDTVLWLVLTHIFGWATALIAVTVFTAVEWLGYLFGIIVPLWGAKKKGLTIKYGSVYYWALDTWYRRNLGKDDWEYEMERLRNSRYHSLCYMGTVIWACLHVALVAWVVLGLLYLVFVQFVWRLLCRSWVVWIFTKSWVRLLFVPTRRLPMPLFTWLVLIGAGWAFVVWPGFRVWAVVIALAVFGLFAFSTVFIAAAVELSSWTWGAWWKAAMSDLFATSWHPKTESAAK